MKIIVKTELKNVARRFKKASWREYVVNRIYNSAKEAKRYHNLRNCNYEYISDEDEVIKAYNNAKLDCYGRRYN